MQLNLISSKELEYRLKSGFEAFLLEVTLGRKECHVDENSLPIRGIELECELSCIFQISILVPIRLWL